jgi:hypothetical protein
MPQRAFWMCSRVCPWPIRVTCSRVSVAPSHAPETLPARFSWWIRMKVTRRPARRRTSVRSRRNSRTSCRVPAASMPAQTIGPMMTTSRCWLVMMSATSRRCCWFASVKPAQGSSRMRARPNGGPPVQLASCGQVSRSSGRGARRRRSRAIAVEAGVIAAGVGLDDADQAADAASVA